MGNATKKQLDFAKQISNTLNIALPEPQTFESLKSFISTNIQEYFKSYYTDLGERIKKEVSILDYVPQAGFTLKQIGSHGLYTTLEHDSIIIDPHKNCYWFNSQCDADSVIGFVAKYIYNGDMKAAIQNLSLRLNSTESLPTYSEQTSQPIKEPPNGLVLPEKNTDMRRVFAYLTKTRLIKPEIVQDFVNQNMLYQDLKGNCVFVSYDHETPVFGCLRGTSTYKRFLGDLPGCDYQKGFFIKGSGSKMIVTESVIDAMSIMSILYDNGINYKQYSFLPLSGIEKNAVIPYHLSHNKGINSILLAPDNDSGGRKMCNLIIEELADIKNIRISKHFPLAKDWNQEIINFFRLGKPLSEIDFFNQSKNILTKTHKNLIER